MNFDEFEKIMAQQQDSDDSDENDGNNIAKIDFNKLHMIQDKKNMAIIQDEFDIKKLPKL